MEIGMLSHGAEIDLGDYDGQSMAGLESRKVYT